MTGDGLVPTVLLKPGYELPAPSLHGAVDPREQARVFEALFQVRAEREQMGRYVILGTLGRGGMGTVLEAFDRTLDRRVALKVLHGNLGEEHKQRLLREAQALAKLSHPNVVQVYEVGAHEGQAYIAMELVQGQTLRDWLSQEPRPGWRERLHVFLQAGEGLAAAHARGLVHRDFKPRNAVIEHEGRVRLLDFGLARRTDEELTATSVDLSVEEAVLDISLTQTGAVMGTPAYMAPEQIRGQEADPRSDQFGYCVSLYEALYGERPFGGTSMAELMVSSASGQVRPVPRGHEVPAALRSVVLRGLAPEPDDRWPSMEELLAELRKLASPRKRRGWLAVGVAGGLAALGLGIAQYAAVGLRCEGAEEWLVGVWDDGRRHEVQQAILDTKLATAADTWERIEPRLDAYAEAWANKHGQVCEATSVRQEQSADVMDLRMECLRGRLVSLRESVGVLAHANETRVQRAMDLVAGLPSLSRCDDVPALRADVPRPEDPAVAKQIESLRGQLAQARSLYRAGEYAQSLAVAEQVVRGAELLSYPSLLAEALLSRADAHYYRDQSTEAERDYARAFAVAAEHGHRQAELEALLGLTWVVGIHQARYDQGLQLGRLALSMARGPGVERRTEGYALSSVGILLKDKGEYDDAMAHFQRALVVYGDTLGLDHPQIAPVLNNIGTVLQAQGEIVEARGYYRKALAIWEDALGSNHHQVAITLRNIGNGFLEQGALEEALSHYRQALAIFEQVLGPEHARVAGTLHNIGTVLRDQGRLEEAWQHYQGALGIYEAALGSGHPNVAYPIAGLAQVALLQEELALAQEYAERAYSIRESAPTSPSNLADSRFLLARALWSDPRQRPRARRLAEQAQEVYADLGEVWYDELADVVAWLADHDVR
ncbi:MAG: serine/threonine-protein kinase [Myxococcota bacterium]